MIWYIRLGVWINFFIFIIFPSYQARYVVIPVYFRRVAVLDTLFYEKENRKRQAYDYGKGAERTARERQLSDVGVRDSCGVSWTERVDRLS